MNDLGQQNEEAQQSDDEAQQTQDKTQILTNLLSRFYKMIEIKLVNLAHQLH